MRNLSLQLEGLAKEQTTMKKRMEEISIGNAPNHLTRLVIQVVLITYRPLAVPPNPIIYLRNSPQLP